jgi:hypothetical protein
VGVVVVGSDGHRHLGDLRACCVHGIRLGARVRRLDSLRREG